MGSQPIEIAAISRVRGRLGEAAVDPSRWRYLLEEMCLAVGAEGGSLRQSGIRTPDVPYTASMEHLTKIYFKEGWHLRDTRVQRVVISHTLPPAFYDFDIFSNDEMSRLFRKDAYFNDFLKLAKLKWGGWIRFQSSGHPWLIAFQRTAAQGPFEPNDMHLLSSLSGTLTEVANLSAAVGRSVLTGVLDGLHLVRLPALALRADGRVLGANAAADLIFDTNFLVRNGRLVMRDNKASQALARILSDIEADSVLRLRPRSRTDNFIVARRETKRPLLIEVLPVHSAGRSPFLGARFILTIRDLDVVRRSASEILSELFALTPVEAKVASMVAAGCSPEEIAAEQHSSRETVRNQIKAIFAKTGTHRQSELAALLSRIYA